jgi:predicted kinase
MPRVHLICGSTGAGKTTYAAALSERIRGVRFSIDDWMANLFLADRPDPSSLDWALQRIDRCERQIWTIAEQLLVRSVDVVFDFGLSTLDQRDRCRRRVAQTAAESKLHYLDVSPETRRARVLKRSQATPRTHVFEVTEAMFEAMEGLFEPPTDDELYGAMIVCED